MKYILICLMAFLAPFSLTYLCAWFAYWEVYFDFTLRVTSLVLGGICLIFSIVFVSSEIEENKLKK